MVPVTKRLFHNNIAEVVAEALQNSQRAGAKNVEVSITPGGFSITDDGHGLLGGIDGFHTLLKLAESAFDNPTIADQDPMGVGIVSLMTHDKVEEIILTSGKLQLTVDTARWWSDRDYYSTWFERVKRVGKAVEGLSIYVRCKAELRIAEGTRTQRPQENFGADCMVESTNESTAFVPHNSPRDENGATNGKPKPTAEHNNSIGNAS